LPHFPYGRRRIAVPPVIEVAVCPGWCAMSHGFDRCARYGSARITLVPRATVAAWSSAHEWPAPRQCPAEHPPPQRMEEHLEVA
jgi:hypothetical protein